MFTGFSHVMMWVNDIERAHKWYIEKLGCKENFATIWDSEGNALGLQQA